ncbi:MAG: HD domain-containing protein [Desulfocapsaceae bacterium]|nr:HD domain-containing protein [Desulfocapsaceae bacterium]
MQKKSFIDQLKDGDRFDDLFLVKSARLAETKAGKPYLILTVADRSGEISGPVWDNAQAMAEKCQAGGFIRLSGQVQSYRDKLQLKVDTAERLEPEEVDPADFVAASTKNVAEMAEALQLIVRSVQNPFIKKLLGRFFNKGDLWVAFQSAPAAKGIHHAYVGGLLEHCLSMARLADFLAGHYSGVDRSLLLAGALLHDIGKLKELEAEMGLIEYTPEGRLKGHLVIGSEMVASEAAGIRDFPPETLIQIQHLILSHHGRQEFGSPAVPMTVEAFLLSQIDDMDAKMNLMEQLRRKITEQGFSWSDYQRPLERYLYLSRLEEEKDEPAPLPVPSKQQSLF